MLINEWISLLVTIFVAAIAASPGVLAYRNQLKRNESEQQKASASASSELVQTSFELMERIKQQNMEIKAENQILIKKVDKHSIDIRGLKRKVRDLGHVATALIHQLHSHNIQPVSTLEEIVNILEEKNGGMNNENSPNVVE